MVNVRVNGQERTFDGDPSMPLMWFLRDELGLTGTKFGCGVSLCGACTVHLNGEAIRSCAIFMSDVAGKSVTTIEGLDPKGQHPVQVAWRDLSVPQCGYCQAGQIMQAAALLTKPRLRATSRSTMPCPATSAVAAATSASMRPFAPLRRGPDMTYHRNQHNVVIANVSRRGLLKGAAGAGLFVLAAQFPAVRNAMAYATGAEKMPHGVVTNPHVFVSIDKDGTVHIVAARAEMGTGAARTTLPMIIADELEADFDRVRIVQGEGDEKKYGNQDTDGSRSVRHWIQPLRQCGASARLMLQQAAAKRWNVEVGEVQAVQHELVHKPTGRKLGYGDVAEEAAALPTPTADQIRLKDPSAFRYIGKGNVPVVD